MFQNNEPLSSREVFSQTARAFRMSWQVSPSSNTALIATTLLNALIPAASAFCFGSLVGVLSDGSGQVELRFAFWLCAVLCLVLLAALCKISTEYFSETLRRRLELEVSHKVLLHLSKLDQEFFEDPRCQDKLARARNHPGKSCFTFVVSSIQAATGVLQLASIVAILVWIDLFCALLLSSLAIPIALIHWRLSTTRYEMGRNKVTKHRWTAYYLKTCTDYLKTPTVRVFDLFPLMADRFSENMRDLNRIDASTARKQAITHTLESAILVAGLFGAAGWLGFRVAKGDIPVEHFVTFWVAAAQFRASLSSLHRSAGQAFELLLFLREFNAFLEESPQFLPNHGAKPNRLRGAITLQNVGFTYRSASQPAVERIDVDFHPGELVALVGPNGAGKTTLAKLILRLYNPNEGVIMVDGQDIRSLHLGCYHEQIGYVGHIPIEFEATVGEIIGYGDWRRLLEEPKRVREIARSLGLEKMIDEMPNGYLTRLGGRFGDHNLSAGQWQKLSIARAIARDPAILILDEPTANLDARYEHDLLSALRTHSHGRTTIIISHRLSTLYMADRIVVMKEGKISEIGKHEELINSNGVYSQLFGATSHSPQRQVLKAG